MRQPSSIFRRGVGEMKLVLGIAVILGLIYVMPEAAGIVVIMGLAYVFATS